MRKLRTQAFTFIENTTISIDRLNPNTKAFTIINDGTIDVLINQQITLAAGDPDLVFEGDLDANRNDQLNFQFGTGAGSKKIIIVCTFES